MHYNRIFLTAAQLKPHAARKGFDGTEQDWGHITVRQYAHMFWWLYYTTADVSNYTERPLIIWLQGGPGMPSSGYGNFGEIGPTNIDLKPRNESVVNNFNVMFVDNPVGVGYSYIDDNKTKLAGNGTEIGQDLFSFFMLFLEQQPEFKEVPVYVFGESYGGKMATDFVYHLMKEQESGPICNLRGLGLGDAYISPYDYLEHYAPMALHLGLIDKRGFTRIDELAKQSQGFISRRDIYKNWDVIEILHREMGGVDIYNFLAKTNDSRMPSLYNYWEPLTAIMENEIKEALRIDPNITWNFYHDEVHEALEDDLSSDVTYKSTMGWLDKLKWPGREGWLNETQSSFEINAVIEGNFKKVNNLVFYSVLRAGHSVPLDNLAAMSEILVRELLS